MQKEMKYIPYMAIVPCEKCGDEYWLRSNITKEERKKLGWRRKWSWKKFCFIWLCPLCAPKIKLP